MPGIFRPVRAGFNAEIERSRPLVPAALVSCVNLIGFGQEVCSRLNTWVEFHGDWCWQTLLCVALTLNSVPQNNIEKRTIDSQ
jgi:hypothetical protein